MTSSHANTDFVATPRVQSTAMWLLFLVSFLNYADRNMLSVLLPAIKKDLELSDTELGFINGFAFALFYAILGIPIARLADRYSRRNILAISLALWSAMTALCGAAQNFVQLAVARVLVGVGEASASPAGHAIIGDLYPAHRRASALALFALGSPFSILIGFSVGGWVAETYGWRPALYAFGLPGLILAVVLYFALPDPPRGYSEREERTSSHGEWAVPPGQTLTQVLVGLFTTKSFFYVCLAGAFFHINWFVQLQWLPSFFTRTHGMPVSDAGLWLALVLGLPQLAGIYLGGWLGNRYTAQGLDRLMTLSAWAGLAQAPFFVLAFLFDSWQAALIVLVIPIMLLFVQLIQQFAVMQAVAGPTRRAVAVAAFLLVCQIIGNLGPQVVGILSDMWSAEFGVQSLQRAMLWVTVAVAPGSAIAAWLGARAIAAARRA
ncbi:MAG: MFS transporter [Alphaproteobacteria bacterium]|nr:MFS transporter [Alphaproteobacteria bacterium]